MVENKDSSASVNSLDGFFVMPKNRGKEGFYGISRKFLWGGATAANQYEGGYLSGGKGLSTLDAILVVVKQNRDGLRI